MTQIIELAATTAKAASLFGVGTIVKNAVQMVTAEAELSEIRKVCVGIASTAIAGATTTAAVKWIDEEAKWADEQFKKLKSEIEKRRKEEAVKVEVETIVKKSEEGKTTTEIAEELNIPERKATSKKKNTTKKKKEEKVEEPKEDESKEA